MAKYVSWTIDDNKATRVMPDGNPISIHLSESTTAMYEGWWPTKPTKWHPVLLTGVCLWDARWQVEFEHSGKGSPPARRSLALPMERDDIYRRIRDGRKVRKIYYPDAMNGYHDILTSWQKDKIEEFRPTRVLYHLPIREYQWFISELESALDIRLDVLHDDIGHFANHLREMIVRRLKSAIGEGSLEFINTTSTDPIESFIEPYLYPEQFGVEHADIIGVEDLVELRLSYEAQRRNGRASIPTLCAVLNIPYPYTRKELAGVKTIVL